MQECKDLDGFEALEMENDLQFSRKVMALDQCEGKHGINLVNVDNLFPRKDIEEEAKLSYNDFLSITQDFVDEETLRQVEKFGYPKSFVRDCLQRGDINHATACYHLLLN